MLVVAGALSLAPAAGGRVRSDLEVVKSGLARAVGRGWLEPAEATRYAGIAFLAARAAPRLPASQAANLAAVLADVASQRDAYTRARALALFSMLELNTRYLARAPMPPAGTDVVAADGVLYRSFPGHGLQFHPLGNFARLGNLMLADRDEEGVLLAQSLAERGIPDGPRLVWEYYFPFGGGRAPWTSGMAQAVAAQALFRAGRRSEARRAYLALRRGLLVWLPAGPWVRLYAFSASPVLNAQLQAALSLRSYATLSGDEDAGAFAALLRSSALALLPRFDTGYWSLYALGGGEASLHYHRYVIALLETLWARTKQPVWADWQAQFERYLEEAPLISARTPTAALAGRRQALIRFWLSKRSRTTLSVAGGARAAWLSRGSHTLRWDAGPRPPGTYAASLTAVDLAGNRTRVPLEPVVVRRRRR